MDLTTLHGWALLTLFVSIIATGLMAGIYVAFSIAVIPGLRDRSDRTFVEAMQSINVRIQNPLFFLIFMGSVAFPLTALVLLIIDDAGEAVWWTALGTLLSALALGITAVRNVPLNNLLDAAGPVDGTADLTATRTAFDAPWMRWNNIRGVSCTLALAALIAAIMMEA